MESTPFTIHVFLSSAFLCKQYMSPVALVFHTIVSWGCSGVGWRAGWCLYELGCSIFNTYIYNNLDLTRDTYTLIETVKLISKFTKLCLWLKWTEMGKQKNAWLGGGVVVWLAGCLMHYITTVEKEKRHLQKMIKYKLRRTNIHQKIEN